MDDEERQKLIAQLDKEFDDFLADAIANAPKHQSEEQPIDELIEELKTHPAFLKEIDPDKPLHPAVEGLQALKYESESPDYNAENYKEDGNLRFKMKKYRWAIDNYTAGIKSKPHSRELNAILYSNRAAANFHIGNFRSSLNDAIVARKFKPDHMKAIVRGAHCCMELSKFEDAMLWCDHALLITPKDPKLVELRAKADKSKRQQDRDKRKEQLQERKREAEEKKLIDVIKSRGVQLAIERSEDSESLDPLMLSSLESHHPSRVKVKLDDDGNLHWPLMFLYPEHTESDFIEAFHEHSTFAEHLQYMFGPKADRAPWDLACKYTPDKLELYFEDEDETLHHVPLDTTLSKILQHKRYKVKAGTPGFIVLVRDSAFASSFKGRYKHN